MGDQMEFPKTFTEFAEDYGFYDYKEVYTNNVQLIPVYRAEQWLDNLKHKPLPAPTQTDILDKIAEELADTCAYEQEVHGKTEFFHGVNYCLSVIEKYRGNKE
jgi:hypothetical protein